MATDRELARIAPTARIDLVGEVDRRAGPFDPVYLAALLTFRANGSFVYDIAESAIDTPLLLDDNGLATVSAPHAYLLSFRVLGLTPGDRLVELGSGSGYGAALASHVVGPTGSVFTVEIDELLAARAARLLRRNANVQVAYGDAADTLERWRRCRSSHRHLRRRRYRGLGSKPCPKEDEWSLQSGSNPRSGSCASTASRVSLSGPTTAPCGDPQRTAARSAHRS